MGATISARLDKAEGPGATESRRLVEADAAPPSPHSEGLRDGSTGDCGAHPVDVLSEGNASRCRGSACELGHRDGPLPLRRRARRGLGGPGPGDRKALYDSATPVA
jgi:hypothetical protein